MANKALDFNGASGDVAISDDAAIQNIFDGGGTIEVWTNPESDGQNNSGRIADKDTWKYHFSSEAASKVKVTLTFLFDGNNGVWETTSTEVDLNTWIHLVLTYNSSDIANDPILYVNGTLVALTETSIPGGTRLTDVGDILFIGNRAGINRAFDGAINEVRLYTRIMAQAEVTTNYNGGAGRYWPSDLRNLVGWWHMNEGTGTNVRDETNRGNPGTITGASFVDGFDFMNMTHVPRRR